MRRLVAVMLLWSLGVGGCILIADAFGPDAWPCQFVDHGNRAGVGHWETQPCAD